METMIITLAYSIGILFIAVILLSVGLTVLDFFKTFSPREDKNMQKDSNALNLQ
jgi:hypothetical protein